MKRTIAKLSLTSFSLAFAACVSGAPAPMTAGETFPVAPASAAAEDEENTEEWESDCKQELGIDSGPAARAHLVSTGEWVSGCFVNGDDVDAFVLEVPEQSSKTIQIEFVHRGGAALKASLISPSGDPLASEGLVLEGAHLSRSLLLEPGQRYELHIAKAPGQGSAWYRFKAASVTQVAAK